MTTVQTAVLWCQVCLLAGLAGLAAGPAAAAQLDLTEAEREFIRAHPVITFSDVRWEPLAMIENGRYQGILHDYYQLVAARTGLTFKFVQIGDGLDFQQVLDALQNKEIDCIDGTGKTRDRERYALFAGPFFRFPLAIASRDDVMAPNTAALLGLRVVVASGSTASEHLRERHPGLPLAFVEDPGTALRMVATSQADAMLDNLAVVAHAIRTSGLTNVKISGQADYTFDVFTLIRDDMPLLQSILDKAHKQIPAREKHDILSRWLPMYPTGVGGEPLEQSRSAERPPLLTLNEWEQAHLRQKGVVRYCIDPDWMPVERINERGIHEGMTADLLALMAERLGVRFELTPTISWPQTLEYVRTRRCDLIIAAGDSPQRRAFLDFTSAYLRFPLVVAARADMPFIEDAAGLYGHTVGVLEDNISGTVLRQAHPGLILTEFSSLSKGLEAVAAGHLDAFVDGLPIISYAIGKENLSDLKVAGRLNESLVLSLAVRRDDPQLLGIMQKAVNTLTPQEIDAAFKKWVTVTFAHSLDAAQLWRIGLAALAVLALLLGVVAWNRKLSSLNRNISQAHEDLEKAHASLGALLDNSGQGFLSFGDDLRLQPQYSRECGVLLQQEAPGTLEGRPIHELLYPDDPQAAAQFATNLQRILAAQDDFKQGMLLSLMPARLSLGARRLRVQYKVVAPGRMMLILTDITHVERLRREVKAERDRLSLVVSAVRETTIVRQLLAEFETFLQGLDEAGRNGCPHALQRQIHTLKGQFAQFDFIHLPQVLHELESALAADGLAALPPLRDTLQEAMAQDVGIIREALGSDFLQRGASLGEARAAGLARQLLHTLPDELLTEDIRRLLQELADLDRVPFRALLGRAPEYALQLAARQGKQLGILRMPAPDDRTTRVSAARFAGFARSLIHVFRNAVDHGIETPDERLAAGKAQEASLSCDVTLRDGLLDVRIADDGRGLDPAALRATAQARGLLTPEQAHALSDAEAFSLILHHGFSTAPEITSLSGRGVGLAAVQAAVQALGGEILVQSQPGQGTTFLFRIPLAAA
ncbi:transporter substrate-binding domain-containing protein [Megalodesulfovibrio gigas]|nr:transporter substrate-binding domain-containing protein [Megalodesulfovibrio gigas]